MPTGAHVLDVDADAFERDVIERSHEVPVVVDFWAEWCGPCRTLGPILEAAVEARDGRAVLAKVDVDAAPSLAGRFGVRGIPAVFGFRDGEVVERFTGAQPRTAVEAFLDRLIPSEADQVAASGLTALEHDPDEARRSFEQALELDPSHRVAAIELARMLADDDPGHALELLAPHRPDPAAEQVAARAELGRGAGGDIDALLARMDQEPGDPQVRLQLGRSLAARGDYEDAIEHLLGVIQHGNGSSDEAREQLLTVFRILGDDHPLVPDARRRLANALF